MDKNTRDMVNQALARYGASLSDDGFIVSQKQQKTGVKVTVKGKRLCFGSEAQLFGSGPIDPSAVSTFVERFWYWKPTT